MDFSPISQKEQFPNIALLSRILGDVELDCFWGNDDSFHRWPSWWIF